MKFDDHVSEIRNQSEESLSVPEKQKVQKRKSAVEIAEAQGKPHGKTICQWLMEATFYIHAIVYTLARLAVNTTSTLMPFYLTQVLEYGDDNTEETPV